MRCFRITAGKLLCGELFCGKDFFFKLLLTCGANVSFIFPKEVKELRLACMMCSDFFKLFYVKPQPNVI